MTMHEPMYRAADPTDATGGDDPQAQGGGQDGAGPVSDADASALEDAADSLADLADAVSATAGGGRSPNVITSGTEKPVTGTPRQFQMPSFDAVPSPLATKAIDLLSDVNLNVKIELGRTRMLVSDVLKLGEGSVVELDKLAGDPVDIYVNDRAIARGEVLVLNENFCVRINEILTQDGDQNSKAAG